MAHELSQPLGIILSKAQAAQELLAQEQPDTVEVQAILADIVKAARRAGEVIERLRTLFRGGLEWIVDGVVREALARLWSGCSAVPGLAS